MGRIRRGWELSKKSWSVVQSERALWGFAVTAVIAGFIVAVAFAGAGAVLIWLTSIDWLAVPIVLIGIYAVIAIGVYCTVALSACAAQALAGQPTSREYGLSIARARLPLILKWAGVQMAVNVVISLIEAALRDNAGPIVGAIVGGLAGFAWRVATFFVIPALALEGLGPKAALRRSSNLIRSRWGEGLVGTAAIGVITGLLGYLPGIILIVGGAALTQAVPAVGVVLIVLGVVVIAVAALLHSTVVAVFKVALFDYAVRGAVEGPFTADELSHAFSPRRRFGRI